MQVKDLIQELQKLDPESHICSLVYTKDMFEYDEDDEVFLPLEAWQKICEQFEEQPFSDIFFSISDAVSQEAVDRYI